MLLLGEPLGTRDALARFEMQQPIDSVWLRPRLAALEERILDRVLRSS